MGEGSASPLVSMTMRPKWRAPRRAAVGDEAMQRHLKVRAYIAAQAAVAGGAQCCRLKLAFNSVIDAGFAEFVDDHCGAGASGVERKCRTSVVFPAPRNPVTTLTGMRAPRSRLEPAPERAS